MHRRAKFNKLTLLKQMKDKKTLIYIKPANSSFISTDQQLLEKNYSVIPFLINQSTSKINYFLSLANLAFFLFGNARRADAFVCWFGDYHAAIMVFVAKHTKKKTIVIAGGQESICYKKLGKGVYLKKLRGLSVKYALRNANLILPNHASLIYHENYFYDSKNPHIDGIKHYVKKIKGDIVVVPNGIDTSRIDRNQAIEKVNNLVLTVGTMNKEADFYNKGFDLFIELAKLNPDKDFVLIGTNRNYHAWIDENYNVKSVTNLTIIPSFCPNETLNNNFNKAKVYLQISITEGMPVSLGEAMLCECIPVGSNVNGIPDAIGDTGIIVKKRNIIELNNALRKAFTLSTGSDARNRILNQYSLSNREQNLHAIISKYI